LNARDPSPAEPASTTAAVPARERVPDERDRVAGLEKGLAVITAFDDDHPRMTMSEVAVACGLTRAAARRYLLTLEHLGFVRCERKMYSLTPKVLRLAQSYMSSARLPRIVQPELHRLACTLKEASSAGVLDGDDVLCVAATNAGRNVSLTLQPGTRVPAYCTANGRMLVASLPAAEMHAWVARQSLDALTPGTIASRDALLDIVLQARRQGYATVDQELEVGLRTLSVPLLSYRGDAVAAMNISVHAARMTMDQLVANCLTPLLQAQSDLRAVL